MKIVFLGDSLTWGGYGGNFVDDVQQRLPDQEIINAGEGGNTVLNLLRRVDAVLDAQQPDGVFVMVGGNDALSQCQPGTRRYYEDVQAVPDGIMDPACFEQHYRDLLTRIQLAHVLAWVGLPPAEYNPDVVNTLREYNAIAARVAQSLNVPVLDLMALFVPDNIPPHPPLTQADINLIGRRVRSGWSDYTIEQQRGGYHFTFDGLHLTPASASHVARTLVEFLQAQGVS